MQRYRRHDENASNLLGKPWIYVNCCFQVVALAIKRQFWWRVSSIVVMLMVAYQFHSMQELVLHLQLPSSPPASIVSMEYNDHHIGRNHQNHHYDHNTSLRNSLDHTVANHTLTIVINSTTTIEPNSTSSDHRADPKTMEKLQRAGLDPTSLSPEALRRIPKWKTIESILGPASPHIVGLDSCADFQEIVGNEERFIGGTLEKMLPLGGLWCHQGHF
jgi:hypothetical protein